MKKMISRRNFLAAAGVVAAREMRCGFDTGKDNESA